MMLAEVPMDEPSGTSAVSPEAEDDRPWRQARRVITHIYRKLATTRRSEAVRRARQLD
jgi:hypothetical protein